MIKADYTLELEADNNFSVLNRIINILNRRRVRIRKMKAHENDEDFRRGGVVMLLYTSSDMIERVKDQFEKLIEVDRVIYHEGSEMFITLTERSVEQYSK
ncbi:MAG: ACT domain-containing protein [Cyclobacteriaceae bacterium]